MVGEGGGEYSRIRTWDFVQDLGEMKDQGSDGVTPSPAEGEVFLALFAYSPISHGFPIKKILMDFSATFTFLNSASCDLVMIHDRHR